ncbi:MAG: carbohydrate ABC transporter permease [Planctomycetota bacterium]
MKSEQRKPLSLSGTILVTVSLVVIAAMFLTPVVWMACTSMKSPTDAAQGGISPLPNPASAALENIVHNYPEVWNDPSITFPIYLRNTLIIAVLSVTGMVLSSAVVAYGFARLNFKGRGPMFVVVLATMMIPFPVVMAPLYLVFRELGWIGTLRPLWVPAWFGGAFNIFLLRQFFMGIPKELDEAARIDGCSHFGVFWRIILPLSKPALAVVALFHFMYVWNDFLGPLIFLTHRDDFTLALGLQLYQSKAGNTPWNLLMAASTMVTIPVLVLYVLAQRTFVQGMSADGLKE